MHGVFLIDWSKINHANLILLFSFEFFVSSDFFIVCSCFFHQVCTIKYVLDLNFETNKVQFFTEINMPILFYRILYHIDFIHFLCTVLSPHFVWVFQISVVAFSVNLIVRLQELKGKQNLV